jgi:anti-sigma factor RsiW
MSEVATDDPISHEEALGLLDDWRDGELDTAEAARVEAHVASCARCQRVETALGGRLKEAVIGGAASSRAEILPGVQRKLRMRSRGRFYGDEPPRRGPSPWPLVVASFAVLAALVVFYLLLGQVGSSSTPREANPTSPLWSPPPASS